MSAQASPANTKATPKLALIGIVGLVIAGLATLDRFLADAQAMEVQRLAERSYRDGLQLRDAGKINQAVEAFRRAHALKRRNTKYELELMDALVAAGKLDEVEVLMRDVLEREPNNGHANLIVAHLMIAQGRPGEAESYYHRAIYGEWPGDAATHRVAVRMELAEFLARQGKQQELLAELLPLQEEAGKNPETERRLAQLFLAAGSASRAADEYRAMIRQNRKDAAAHAGLGEAELQLGEYRLAREAFLGAAELSDSPSIRQRAELARTLMSVDPMGRKLTSIEKYHRSLKILELARSDLERCVEDRPGVNSDQTRQLLASANDALSKKPRPGATNEMAEEPLSLAEQAWQVRNRVCTGIVTPTEEPLRLLMEKLKQ